ncbi:uncharacterized protein LOC128555479 [Mercenaria mercenaria]|uniref:uncharacterized protein LOC128555479 n=1 Tax=Mercenaria mercenaria TaxID=6596 RepID=UPI00234EE114|nr:uncharacterized protein LOC128555479 [Mercenaria mercenaria]
MAKRIPDELEDFDTEKLCDWLRTEQKCDESIVQSISDAEITGRIFIDLDDGDLKDLFSSFLQRKQIRKILKEVHADTDEIEVTPSKRQRVALPARSPVLSPAVVTPSTSGSLSSSSVVSIPKSLVLEEPQNYSVKEIDFERKKIIRLSMDSMIGTCGGRPTETEIQQQARALAAAYPTLRDNPTEGIRENYVIGHENPIHRNH